MYFLYSTLVALALVLGAPYWLLQMLRHGKYRAGLRERLGIVPARISQARKPTVWVHAVSVGEVLAISKLVDELRRRFPRVVISTTTHTGQRLARERFGEADVFYFPLDLPVFIRRYMRALAPGLVVLAETEFWPNFLRMAKASGAKVAVVNARISDRSLPRYAKRRRLLARVLDHVDLFLAQSDEDAKRLVAIGAGRERVHVSGNLKFEVQPPADIPFYKQLKDAVAATGAAPIWLAGSTVEGEEPLVIEAFRTVTASYPSALLLLAPRHKERFDAVAGLLSESGLSWTRRSRWEQTSHELPGSVLLLDSIGELASLFPLADVAFIGGSMVPKGGHNILEPAQAGVATVVGPHTENFRDIVQIFSRAGAVQIVEPRMLAATVLALFDNPDERETLGTRARQVLVSQKGATERTVTELERLFRPGVGQ